MTCLHRTSSVEQRWLAGFQMQDLKPGKHNNNLIIDSPQNMTGFGNSTLLTDLALSLAIEVLLRRKHGQLYYRHQHLEALAVVSREEKPFKIRRKLHSKHVTSREGIDRPVQNVEQLNAQRTVLAELFSRPRITQKCGQRSQALHDRLERLHGSWTAHRFHADAFNHNNNKNLSQKEIEWNI